MRARSTPVIADDRLPRPREASHLTRRAKVVILAAIIPVVVAVAVLPLILLTVPNPHPVKIPGLAGEIAGTYVQRADGLYRLFPYTAPVMTFPSDALVVDGTQPQVIVKYRQLDLLTAYGISRYSDSQEIQVKKTVDQTGKALYLEPTAPLAAGQYMVTAARDGADAGTDYFYFLVP
jgi:hypothetical protein